MSFIPLISTGWLISFAVVLLGISVWGYLRNRDRGTIWSWVRRLLIGVFLAVALAGPAVQAEELEVTSNVEIVLAVDRTGSMAAEDGPEGAPRLDAVREDIAALVNAAPEARFAVVTWDSSARVELPFTTDSSAVLTFAELLHQEISEFSTGSTLERPVQELVDLLASASEARPQNLRYLVVFTDGEGTGESAAGNVGGADPWAGIAPLIDGGAVLGYGTADGAPMRLYIAGEGPAEEYMLDENGNQAISRMDEDALRGLADALGVDLLVNPTKTQVAQLGTGFLSGGELGKEGKGVEYRYRYLTWIPALLGSTLVIWEAVALSGVITRWRRTGAI